MTTIVADRRGMASDSGLVNGEGVFTENAKKVHRIGDCLVGATGTTAVYEHLLYKLKKADKSPVDYLFDMCGTTYQDASILILNKGGIWCFSNGGVPFRLTDKFASIGSGWLAAKGAMMAGATVQKATRIAIKLDTNSFGRVKYTKL